MNSFKSRTRDNKKTSSRSDSDTKSARSDALSLGHSKGRYPAIDLRTNADVSTLVCVELSKSILSRPEVNTGNLFSAIAAANYDVNKSDAVIVVTAAVMEAIGSPTSARSLLRKSRTVSAFYEKMNLTNESVRNSFVIMLFAIAPEFVKMIESAVKISLERVQAMTEAPHANGKMVAAAGELLKDGDMTADEHFDLMDTFSSLRVSTDMVGSSDSIMSTPDDMVGIQDSVSQVGKRHIVKDPSPMNARTLMRYIKGTRNDPETRGKFYEEFPSVRRPVEATLHRGKTGVGYPTAQSAFTETVTEDNVADAVNSLMTGFERPRRHILNSDDKKLFKNPVSFTRSSANTDLNEKRRDSFNASVYQDAEMAITREDIENMKTSKNYFPSGGSKPDTNPSEDSMDDFLRSLL